ncbi:MAG: AbrB family transcriptional regulator [Chitinophagaceae bacterium]|nr:AbrB family transcriptional regulator [Polaromonas sp.]
MSATAKIFSAGNSQAVRLPKAFRVSVSEMWIAKNEVTGEITLKPKDEDGRKSRLELLFKLIRENPLPDDFLSDATRRNDPPRHPFADWADDIHTPTSAKSTKAPKAKK